MRSLKCFKSYKVLGLSLRVGEWYKIYTNSYNVNKFWLAKFYGISENGCFLHKDNSYVVDGAGVRLYPTHGYNSYPLCLIRSIRGIELVDWEYVEGIITF
jgi:hypothetical protein